MTSERHSVLTNPKRVCTPHVINEAIYLSEGSTPSQLSLSRRLSMINWPASSYQLQVQWQAKLNLSISSTSNAVSKVWTPPKPYWSLSGYLPTSRSPTILVPQHPQNTRRPQHKRHPLHSIMDLLPRHRAFEWRPRNPRRTRWLKLPSNPLPSRQSSTNHPSHQTQTALYVILYPLLSISTRHSPPRTIHQSFPMAKPALRSHSRQRDYSITWSANAQPCSSPVWRIYSTTAAHRTLSEPASRASKAAIQISISQKWQTSNPKHKQKSTRWSRKRRRRSCSLRRKAWLCGCDARGALRLDWKTIAWVFCEDFGGWKWFN